MVKLFEFFVFNIHQCSKYKLSMELKLEMLRSKIFQLCMQTAEKQYLCANSSRSLFNSRMFFRIEASLGEMGGLLLARFQFYSSTTTSLCGGSRENAVMHNLLG